MKNKLAPMKCAAAGMLVGIGMMSAQAAILGALEGHLPSGQAQVQDVAVRPESVTIGEKGYSPYLDRGYPRDRFARASASRRPAVFQSGRGVGPASVHCRRTAPCGAGEAGGHQKA